MIEDGDTIRFRPEDVPELPELKSGRRKARRRRETPAPEGWKPLGYEW